MRIAISGAQNVGKSTLIKDFLTVWPSYTTTEKTYRDILREQELPHSTKTNKLTQLTIINWMVDELKKTNPNSNVIFDRCPLDCLAYTLWAYEKGDSDITEEFVSYVIKETKEAMRHLDIIFYIPAGVDNIKISADGIRETSEQYQVEIDNIFKSLKLQLEKNYDADVFFPKGDSPGLLTVSGTREQRLVEIGQYVNSEGNLYGDENSIFSPQHLDQMEDILRQQKEQLEIDNRFKDVKKIITDIKKY